MTNTILKIFTFLLISICKTNAQSAISDSIFYQKAINRTKALYYQSVGDQSGLFNGSQYPAYPFNFKENGHPFFQENTFSKGSITYDGIFYPDVNLLYDEVSNVIIVQDKSRQIQLINDKIAGFSITNKTFIQIKKDNRNDINTGFYQILYDGKTSILKREIKSINEILGSTVEGISRYIKTENVYYIQKENICYSVNQKKAVLNIYKEHKKEIQQFMKANSLNFKKDKDDFLIKISTYNDQLTK